jgi:hypothetical protein
LECFLEKTPLSPLGVKDNLYVIEKRGLTLSTHF